MKLSIGYTNEQPAVQAERLGKIFGIEDAGTKIARDGLLIEQLDTDAVMVKVTLHQIISIDEANALLRAEPLDHDQPTADPAIQNYADRVLAAQPIRSGNTEPGVPSVIPAQHVAAVLHALADYTHNSHMLRVADERLLARPDDFQPRVDSLGRYFHALADSIEQRLQYVACNRLLGPETNEHCEFDGRVLIDEERGNGVCPWCRGPVLPAEATDAS